MTTIKDAPIVEQLIGTEKFPISDGSGEPVTATIQQIIDKCSGIPIVDSEDKLDSNAPQGSLGVVAYNTVTRVSVRDLYQPTVDDVDMSSGEIFNPEKLSKVDKLEFTFPKSVSAEGFLKIYLVPRTFGPQNVKMLTIGYESDNGVVQGIGFEEMASDFTTYKLCQYDENGVPSVNQENIDILNNLLVTDDWCYFSNLETGFAITEAQFDLLDKFVKSVSGVQGTDLYIKEPSKFVKQETKVLSKVPTNLSSYKNDVGYLTELNSFKNIEQIDLPTTTTIDLKEDTLIHITSEHIETLKIKIKIPDSGTKKYGLFFDLSYTAGVTTFMFYNYICWKNPIPLGDPLLGKNLIVIEYSGHDNMFIGDYYKLEEYKLVVQYNIPEIGVYPILNKDYPLEYISGCDSHEKDFKNTGWQSVTFNTQGLNEKMFDGIDNIKSVRVEAPYVNYAFNNIPKIHLSDVCRYFTVFDTDNKFELGVSSVEHLTKIYFKGIYGYQSIFSSISALYLGSYLCKDLIIPEGTDISYMYTFKDCTCLDSITIEKDVMFGDNCFSGCTGTLILKAKPTRYGTPTAFNGADFNRVIIKNNIGSLDNLFKACAKVEKYDFSSVTEIPSITQTSFSQISNTCQIVVPDSLYDEWIDADNWNTYASHIIKESEYVESTELDA